MSRCAPVDGMNEAGRRFLFRERARRQLFARHAIEFLERYAVPSNLVELFSDRPHLSQ
jgi:hypothetical protein